MLKQKQSKTAKGKQVAKTATKTITKAKSSSVPATKSERRIVPAGKPVSSRALATTGDWESMAGAGGERVTMRDLAIPRLAILQALSPQCNKQDARYIEGAEPGDICDTVTGVLYSGSGGIDVVPVCYRRAHIEWVPRKKGGGFVADHDSVMPEGAERDAETGAWVLPNGNEVRETGEYFVFVVESGEHTPFVLSMGGTQLKKSRQWNTMIQRYLVPSQKHPGTKVNPPWWYRSYKLTTVPEQNDKGNWMAWHIEPGENTFDLDGGKTIFEEATNFYKQVKSGRVSARPPVSEDEVPAGRDTGDSPPQDDEIPF